MKIGIFVREDLDIDEDISTLLISKISEFDLDFDMDNPDVVIFVGGDGTLLRAVHEYIDHIENISFVGINKGSLGFACDYDFEEIDDLFADIVNNNFNKLSLNLLQGRLENETIYALNEIRIENPFHTLISEVYIDDEYLENFKGNGLTISSSFGSSAYNKSLGGAIVNPEIPTLQLTENAPINSRVYHSLNSSLILDDSKSITLSGDFSEAVIGFDHLTIQKENLSKIEVSISNKSINVIYKKSHSFYRQINKAFIR